MHDVLIISKERERKREREERVPAVIVRNTMQKMPSCTRKGLISAGRNAVVKQAITSRMSTQYLIYQGREA